MTIAMIERAISTTKPLKNKVSLVTGSTSGIGLGIARALAAAGSAVVLNGFGAPEEIKATQAGIGADFGVPVAFSGADMTAISCFKWPAAGQVMMKGCRRWGVELPVIGAPPCDCACETVCDEDVWTRK
jgi:NAD(P)-dependent dehydrogenase (short-subunit alcohol dehydrogenase family)